MGTKVICTVCKGEELSLDALVYWDTDRQDWVVVDVAEPRAWCEGCQTDTEWDMADIETGKGVYAEWQADNLQEGE